MDKIEQVMLELLEKEGELVRACNTFLLEESQDDELAGYVLELMRLHVIRFDEVDEQLRKLEYMEE